MASSRTARELCAGISVLDTTASSASMAPAKATSSQVHKLRTSYSLFISSLPSSASALGACLWHPLPRTCVLFSRSVITLSTLSTAAWKEFLHPFKSFSPVDLVLMCVVVCDYAALRFVLSEQHQNLRPEDRSKLLNVSSPSVLQCLFCALLFGQLTKLSFAGRCRRISHDGIRRNCLRQLR